MSKYLILVSGLIIVSLIWINFGVGVSPVFREVKPDLNAPHYYNNPKQAIGKIHITAVYFVPKNKQGQQIKEWKDVLESNLVKLQAFHDIQLRNRSKISYTVLSDSVVGFMDNLEYDTDSTQHGNPEGLRRIAGELNNRIISPQGDLYRPGLISDDGDVYNVFVVLYEGVGASGSENTALISRIYFTDPQYEKIGSTTFAHEFYHTLGLPDAYEVDGAIPTSADIMGFGVTRPLERNYIAGEFLAGMGI